MADLVPSTLTSSSGGGDVGGGGGGGTAGGVLGLNAKGSSAMAPAGRRKANGGTDPPQQLSWPISLPQGVSGSAAE